MKCIHVWFVFSLFRVYLVLLDIKVKVEILVLRWERNDAPIMHKMSRGSCWRPHPRLITEKKRLSLNHPHVSAQGPRGIQGPPGQTGKPGKRVSELGDPVHSHCSVCVYVCVHSHASVFIVVCVSLCGCLYLWSLLKCWEAYFQSNKQLLDMCLKACAASNPRINGRPVNLSENAKTGKLATDIGRN